MDFAAAEISLVNADLTVHPLPEGQHSFILGAGRVPEVDQAIQQTGQWLRRHLGT